MSPYFLATSDLTYFGIFLSVNTLNDHFIVQKCPSIQIEWLPVRFYVLCFSMFLFPHKFSRPQVYLFERRLYIFVALRAQVYILRPANFRWRRSNWCTTGSQGWRWGEEIGKVARNEIEFVVNWIFWMLQMKWNVLFISTLSIMIEGFQMRLWIWKRDCGSQAKILRYDWGIYLATSIW